MHTRLMKLNEVKFATGLSRASIYQLVSRGQFPQQCRINERSVAWVSTEVQQWIDAKIASRPVQ
jgi:prophage regulatory protein